jgi:hypothetical protein
MDQAGRSSKQGWKATNKHVRIEALTVAPALVYETWEEVPNEVRLFYSAGQMGPSVPIKVVLNQLHCEVSTDLLAHPVRTKASDTGHVTEVSTLQDS